MYKVIRQFKDTDERIYEIGEEYNGTEERIEVLVTGNNKYNEIYIEEVKQKPKRVTKKVGEA